MYIHSEYIAPLENAYWQPWFLSRFSTEPAVVCFWGEAFSFSTIYSIIINGPTDTILFPLLYSYVPSCRRDRLTIFVCCTKAGHLPMDDIFNDSNNYKLASGCLV